MPGVMQHGYTSSLGRMGIPSIVGLESARAQS
jgi:hypothetical protein